MKMGTTQTATCCVFFMLIVLIVILRIHPETLLESSVESSTRYHGRHRRSLLNNVDKEHKAIDEKYSKIKFTSREKDRRDQQDESCQFGFDFLDKLIEDHKRQRVRQRHPLPVKLTHEISGALVQEGTNCADTMDGTAGNEIGVYACHGQGRNQEFTIHPDGTLQVGEEGKRLCVSVKPPNNAVILNSCIPNNDNKKWSIDYLQGRFRLVANPHLCLSTNDGKLTTSECSSGTPTWRQVWRMEMTQVLGLKLQAKRQKKVESRPS